MTNQRKSGFIVVSLLSTTLLTGCGIFVWKSDYDALQQQDQQLQQQLAASNQQVTRLQGAIKYTVNSDLLFAPGSWQMKPGAENIIAGFAQKLAPTQQTRLLVAGYTNNTPIGSALQRQGVTSNQELSQKRADAVMAFLVSQGVKPELVEAKGFGDADPVDSNASVAGRAKNRRVELSLESAPS
jgi:chemotaxis protein MotB